MSMGLSARSVLQDDRIEGLGVESCDRELTRRIAKESRLEESVFIRERLQPSLPGQVTDPYGVTAR
jgi:hypothetical protein